MLMFLEVFAVVLAAAAVTYIIAKSMDGGFWY